MNQQAWALVGLYVLSAGAVFVLRNWSKTSIEQSIHHRFDTKIEELRADLRKSEEGFKGELRLKESEIAALRDGILSGRQQRQSLLDKRRLDAVERLWSAMIGLAPLKALSDSMGAINFEAASRETPHNLKLRKFFETLISSTVGNPKNLQAGPDSEQPFLTPLAWAFFSAYKTVVYMSYIRAKVLELGLENPSRFLNETRVKELLKATLPECSIYIESVDSSAYHLLLENLKQRLLDELREMLDGSAVDENGILQAARIMELVDKFKLKVPVDEGQINATISKENLL